VKKPDINRPNGLWLYMEERVTTLLMVEVEHREFHGETMQNNTCSLGQQGVIIWESTIELAVRCQNHGGKNSPKPKCLRGRKLEQDLMPPRGLSYPAHECYLDSWLAWRGYTGGGSSNLTWGFDRKKITVRYLGVRRE